jgi:hypothetical protein
MKIQAKVPHDVAALRETHTIIDFMATSSARQVFFAQYAAKAMQVLSDANFKGTDVTPPLVLLTGGLRTAGSMQAALRHQHAQLLGIGRPSVLRPELPRLLRGVDDSAADEKPLVMEPDLGTSIWSNANMPKLVGAGASTAWYIVQMRHLAYGQGINSNMGATGAVLRMWIDHSTRRALCILGAVVVALVLLYSTA